MRNEERDRDQQGINALGEMGIGRSTRDEHNDKFTGSAE